MLRHNFFESLEYTIDYETFPAIPVDIPGVIPKAAREDFNLTSGFGIRIQKRVRPEEGRWDVFRIRFRGGYKYGKDQIFIDSGRS
jgi:hypothetical protein